MSGVPNILGYPHFQVYLKYQVIPGISGYPIPDDFQNWVEYQKECWVAGGYWVPVGPWSCGGAVQLRAYQLVRLLVLELQHNCLY